MSKNVWKDIPNYEGLYEVSNCGNVRIYKNKRILKPSDNGCGYLQVVLTKNGERKNYKIHKLVAITFIQNPNGYPCINHKDENKKNNNVNNLEFCTYLYNCNYGTRNYRCTRHRLHKVNQYDLFNNFLRTYDSLKEAELYTGVKYQNISACCRKSVKTAGEYKWRYANE